MNYHKVAVGGTFEHFHRGHEALLKKAFEIGQEVVVGITSNSYTSTHKFPISKFSCEAGSCFARQIEDYKIRENEVKAFLNKHDFQQRCEIMSIHDSYGPTIDDPSFDAIVVSPETEKTAHEINKKRVVKGLKPLVITRVPWVLGEEHEPIHSTRIRAGEISRDGKVFAIPASWGVRKISQELRQELKKPVGVFIQGDREKPEEAIKKFLAKPDLASQDKLKPFITVGDAVTHSFLSVGITPWASIIDYHVERTRKYDDIYGLGFDQGTPVVVARNKAGTLSYELFDIMRSFFKQQESPKVLAIEGEEDLTVLFAILLLPLQSLIIYGQPADLYSSSEAKAESRSSKDSSRQARTVLPPSGIVVVEVTEEMKERTMKYLSQFTPRV